jgi:hypothetical protein
MRKYLLGAALLSVLAISCNKNKDMENATVVDTGDVAQGGCGYILKLEDGGRELRPDYLPSAFQHNGYKVKIKYNTAGEQFVCQTYPTNSVYELIELADIRRDFK